MNDQTDILFIGGHRKSGTSMFRGLFDDHGSLAVYPTDIALLYAYYPNFIKNHKEKSVLKDRIDKILFKEVKRVLSEIGRCKHENEIKKWRKRFYDIITNGSRHELRDIWSVLDALTCSFEYFDRIINEKEQNQNRWTVVKETSIEIYAHDLLEEFENAQFLHLVRDPRDTYAALYDGVDKYYSEFGEDENVTLFSLLNRLGTGLKCGIANCEQFGDERYKVVYFEDLVSNPRPVMKEIAAWLGIEFSSSLLKPTKAGEQTKGNSFREKEFKGVDDSHKGKWKDRISEKHSQVVEFYLSDVMKRYGYELTFDKTEARRSVAEFYKWSNYKYFYFDSFGSEAREDVISE